MPGPPSTSTAPERVYHMELRHFPRNLCRYNLSGEELRATVLEPWVADRLFELGELRWDPRQARLTVLEGPRIPPEQLSMGRGWRTAQRQSRDVTEQLLAATAEAPAGGGEEGGAEIGGRVADLVADSLGLELLARMGGEQLPLRQAWEWAATREPSAPASATLAVAEHAVAALLRARLVVLLRAGSTDACPAAEDARGGVWEAGGGAGALGDAPQALTAEPMGEEDAVSLLRALESWAGDRRRAQVWMRRA